MPTRLSRILALGLVLALAACATTPPPPADLTPPPPRATDAKTQLESGRRMYALPQGGRRPPRQPSGAARIFTAK
jgi:hypothetical protein